MPLDPWCDPAAVQQAAGCTDQQAQDATTAASVLLWRRSGRVYGTLSVRLRPTGCHYRDRRWAARDIGWGLPMPFPGPGPYGGFAFNFGASWWAAPLGWCCGDKLAERQLLLPDTVKSVLSVEQDGTDLDPAAWRFDLPNRLVRTDGDRWRHDQDLTLEAGSPGTWSVSLTVGRTLPVDTGPVALELATEFAKDYAGKPCALPQRVTQVSKQGVTFLMSDPLAIAKEMLTGLQRVDRWILSVNPNRLQMPSQVYIPGEEDEDDDYRQVL